MKEIELFYLPCCPYCKNARKAIEALTEENASYGSIHIRWIDERAEAALANSRDYYSVPTLYYNGEKLYEAKPTHSYEIIKSSIQAAFDRVIAD